MAKYDAKLSELYVAEYDFTPYTREFSGMPGPRTLHDVTVWGDEGRKSFPMGAQGSTPSWRGFFDDTATTGPDAALGVLKAKTADTVISYYPGDTVLGNYGWIAEDVWQPDQEITSHVGSMVEMSASWQTGAVFRARSFGPKATVTADTTGSSVDDSSSSTGGIYWVYHIFAWSASGGNAQWVLHFDDSPDDAAWTSQDSVNITAVGGALRTITGSVNRYTRVRILLDATSGSITYFVSYHRV